MDRQRKGIDLNLDLAARKVQELLERLTAKRNELERLKGRKAQLLQQLHDLGFQQREDAERFLKSVDKRLSEGGAELRKRLQALDKLPWN